MISNVKECASHQHVQKNLERIKVDTCESGDKKPTRGIFDSDKTLRAEQVTKTENKHESKLRQKDRGETSARDRE